jgi:hypothetical protein
MALPTNEVMRVPAVFRLARLNTAAGDDDMMAIVAVVVHFMYVMDTGTDRLALALPPINRMVGD